MPEHDHRKDTADALRHDLDAGRGRDKTSAPDPAAAPLGTDDEAAGTPISPEQASRARDREIHAAGPAPGVIPPAMTNVAGSGNAAPDRRETVFPTDMPPTKPGTSGRAIRWVIGVFVAVVVLWLLLGLFGQS
ncbi:hypothetical protein [Roseinatronobacter alkalisoli]|uniref:Uncharacterized protein n=1 Tax=Roseinatronobacter alkalisoli TaxID=3028235 RepID=A0ABT5TCD8_9RHOB|nr:hypothetical protein [Roseinatronobacter sp. HJB301]MDD7972788.1 hypothetical protein [Roseinatronobacter sp. HJB301]